VCLCKQLLLDCHSLQLQEAVGILNIWLHGPATSLQNTLYSVWDSLLESFDVYKVSGWENICTELLHASTACSGVTWHGAGTMCCLTIVVQVETIGDSYVAACGLFSRDPLTGAKRLGGHDPDHAKKMIAFAKAMLWSSQSIKTPLGEPVQCRIGETWSAGRQTPPLTSARPMASVCGLP
jgi:hypothetical protein